MPNKAIQFLWPQNMAVNFNETEILIYIYLRRMSGAERREPLAFIFRSLSSAESFTTHLLLIAAIHLLNTNQTEQYLKQFIDGQLYNISNRFPPPAIIYIEHWVLMEVWISLEALKTGILRQTLGSGIFLIVKETSFENDKQKMNESSRRWRGIVQVQRWIRS